MPLAPVEHTPAHRRSSTLDDPPPPPHPPLTLPGLICHRLRYNVGRDPPHGGLLVLGADFDTLPCEGGTVTSPPTCGGGGGGGGNAKGAAILESGMDNRYCRCLPQQS